MMAFPKSAVNHCPTCKRVAARAELSECTTCGALYCKFDKWDCPCNPVTLGIRIVRRLPTFLQGPRFDFLLGPYFARSK
jgi:hypothetical protein